MEEGPSFRRLFAGLGLAAGHAFGLPAFGEYLRKPLISVFFRPGGMALPAEEWHFERRESKPERRQARMKIGDGKPAGGVSPLSSRERVRARDGGEVSSRIVSDSASIMGIPEAELTPRVRDALMQLMGEVAELRREVSAMQERLREASELADRDPLIPVLNRRAFVRELSRVIAYARRYGDPAGLVYFDIDNFKQVNDAHGHAAGDAALHHLAKLVLGHVRETDIAGRLGGDELGLILVRTDEADAKAKAQSLAELVAGQPLRFGGKEISLSISVGAVAFTGEDGPDDALARADRAMYEAKRNGG